MIHALFALLAQGRPQPTDPWLSQGFVELPCAFYQNVPIVTVTWSDGPWKRRSKFVLDTGATVSFLLDAPDGAAARRVRISGGTKRDVSLGSVQFDPLPKGVVGTEFVATLRKNEAVGVLGAGFAATRDVLIDYRRGRLYVSPPKKPDDPGPTFQEKLGFRCVQAIPIGDRWAATVVWRREPYSIAFMLVDTGTTNTVMSVADGSVPQPPNAKTFTSLGALGPFSGWIERRKLYVAPLKEELDAEVQFTTYGIDPVLAPSTLGDRVLLLFRRNEVWVPPAAPAEPPKGRE